PLPSSSLLICPPPRSTLFPYTTLFRSGGHMVNTAKTGLMVVAAVLVALLAGFLWGSSGKSTIDRALQRSELRNELLEARAGTQADRKSTRLNSSHRTISYAVFCLKKKK